MATPRVATDSPEATRSVPRAESKAPEERFFNRPPHMRLGRVLAYTLDSRQLTYASIAHLFGRHRILALERVRLDTVDSETARQATIKSVISQSYQRFNQRATEVVLSVAGPETVYRTLLLPVLSGQNLKNAVRFEAAKQIPFAIEDCAYDFVPISQVTVGDTKRLKVGFFAVTRRYLESHLRPFQELGIQVSAVQQGNDTVGQLLPHIPDYHPKGQFTLLRLNSSNVEIAFFRGTNLELLHQVSLDSLFMFGYGEEMEAATLAGPLAGEITTALDYYSGQFSRSSTNKIYAYGALSGIDGLIEALELRTGMDIRRFPTGQLTFLGGQDPFFANKLRDCLTAVAGCFTGTGSPNLLTEEQKASQRERRIERTVLPSAIGVLLILLLLWLQLVNEQYRLADERRVLEEQTMAAQSSPAFRAHEVTRARILANQGFFEGIDMQPARLSYLLKELSLITPNGIQLRSLEYKQGSTPENLLLQGIVKMEGAPPELLLVDYVHAFRASSLFTHVRLSQYARRPSEGGIALEFSLGLGTTL